MPPSDIAEQWKDGAKKALLAASHLIESHDYEFALFTCHLAIEKSIKARIVSTQNIAPPKSHQLLYLAEKTTISLTEEEKMELREISSFSELARYGDESWIYTETQTHIVQKWFERTQFFVSLFLQ